MTWRNKGRWTWLRPEAYRSDEELELEIEAVEASVIADIQAYGAISSESPFNLYYAAHLFGWPGEVGTKMPDSVVLRWEAADRRAALRAYIASLPEGDRRRREFFLYA
jgi:hypothetical protein